MDKEIRKRGLDALKEGDLGKEVDDGLFIKDLGRVTRQPNRSKGEVEPVAPVSSIRPKTPADAEKLVGAIAAQVMDHFINTLNEPGLNPIRDGIPECTHHRFPPGCVYGCQTGVMPRVMHHSLGDVFEWVKALARVHYRRLLDKHPRYKGWSNAA